MIAGLANGVLSLLGPVTGELSLSKDIGAGRLKSVSGSTLNCPTSTCAITVVAGEGGWNAHAGASEAVEDVDVGAHGVAACWGVGDGLEHGVYEAGEDVVDF